MEFKLNEGQLDKIRAFVVTGIIVLTLLVVVGLGMKYVPNMVAVTTSPSSTELPIYAVDTKYKKVSLSFEVGSSDRGLAEILSILEEKNIKATFFINGKWLDKYPKEAKLIIKSGHDLGNHTNSHIHMSELEQEAVYNEILDLHKEVKEITGVDMNLFRVPFADFNNTVIRTSKEMGYYPVLWNIDSRDWKDYSASSIINSVLDDEDLTSGSIIRFHVDAKYILEALPSVVVGIQEEGFEIVPISELIYTKEYYVDSKGRQVEKTSKR